MKKRKGIRINFTNRWLYTLIAILILAVIGVGVYALNPGVIPNPGHNYTAIATCAEGQGLVTQGGKWVCSTGGGYCAGGTCNGNLIVNGKLTASSGRLAFYNITDKGCSGTGSMTTSPTCKTAMGSTGDCGNKYLFNRCGEVSKYPNCKSSPQTCQNTLLGYLV